MVNDHSLNTVSSETQAPKPSRKRYKSSDTGIRPARGRPKKLGVAFKCPSPLLLTGGESIKLNVIPLDKPVFCSVDFLTFSVLWDNAACPFYPHLGTPFDENYDTQYINDLKEYAMEHADFEPFFDCVVEQGRLLHVVLQPSKPFNFCRFAQTAYIVDQDTGEFIPIATIGLHEANEVKRWIFLITGSQCRFFDMAKVRAYMEKTQAVISRLDLAVDDFQGVKTVDYAQELYESKSFISFGRNPSFRRISSSDGSTFYIGKKANGKELCVYEKGKESKSDLYPNWVRWEQRFGNADGRVIPHNALTNTAGFFLGAHAVLPSVFPNLHAATIERIRIKTTERASEDIAKFFKYASIGYGAGVKTLLDKGVPGELILRNLARPGTQASVGQPTPKDALLYFETRGAVCV